MLCPYPLSLSRQADICCSGRRDSSLLFLSLILLVLFHVNAVIHLRTVRTYPKRVLFRVSLLVLMHLMPCSSLVSSSFQAVYSVRAAAYHGRLFSTSYVTAQKVISCLLDSILILM